jgi:hypothetical protein
LTRANPTYTKDQINQINQAVTAIGMFDVFTNPHEVVEADLSHPKWFVNVNLKIWRPTCQRSHAYLKECEFPSEQLFQ